MQESDCKAKICLFSKLRQDSASMERVIVSLYMLEKAGAGGEAVTSFAIPASALGSLGALV